VRRSGDGAEHCLRWCVLLGAHGVDGPIRGSCRRKEVKFMQFDLVASLQALPETDPVEVDGIQLGGTCACVGLLTAANTVCVGVSC
jgi:hypothetical protein